MTENIFPKGFYANGIHCGIKKNRKNDLSIFYSQKPSVAAGVFTKNLVKAAPIIVSQNHIKNKITGIIANSGCANACTGEKGIKDAQKMCELTAKGLNVKPENILVASTGVIGQFLPMSKIEVGIKQLIAQLRNKSATRFQDSTISQLRKSEMFTSAIEGIMTTDTFPKFVSSRFTLHSSGVSIWGCCKGSGMIHPNMATMLSFILTDISINKTLLTAALKSAVEKSFNRISVDGDTSTNDCVFILANGAAENPAITKKDENFLVFQKQLEEICITLSKMIVRDGEGATKVAAITVKNATDQNAAKKIAQTIATSPLVKTALFGADANWGRILAAAGRSGVKFDPDKVDIYLGDILVAKNGSCVNFSESEAKKELKKTDLRITVNLNCGKACSTYFTTDLTLEYVKINASYRS